MFQSGYLTIKAMEDDIIFLAYPNQEVKKSFSEILMQYLFETTLDTFYLAGKLGKALEQEDLEEIRTHIDSIFASIPYPLYGEKDKPNEAYFPHLSWKDMQTRKQAYEKTPDRNTDISKINRWKLSVCG